MGLLLLAIVPMFFSCQVQKGWVYKANSYTPVEKSEEKIYIPTFSDEREEENRNSILMFWIPLVPFGWQDLTTPELCQQHLTSGLWINYDPKVDFAKALVQEIKSGTKFKEVVYTDGFVDSVYRIQGKIINTDYKSKMYSYCLSYFGACLWYFGLPAGKFHNNLEIELTCYGPDNQIFLQKTYHPKPIRKTTWIYKMQADFSYSTLLKKAYADFIRDFNYQLQNYTNK